MSQWLSGNELTERWNILDFELLNYVIKGLQPYDRETGQPVPSPEVCSKKIRLRDSRELLNNHKKGIQYYDHYFQGKFKPGDVEDILSKHTYRDREKATQLAQEKIESLEKEISATGPSWENYSLPDSTKARLSLISEVLKYIYKSDDVENFEKLYNLAQKDSMKTAQAHEEPGSDIISSEIETPKPSPENFIKNLIIAYESDNEIRLQPHGKKSITRICRELGFRDNNTNAWKTFINILQEPPHIYNAGPAHQNLNGKKQRVKQYDSRLKCLSSINGKLINFLNQLFKAGIPEDYKLYEKCKAEESGTFKFKFQVALDDTIKSSNKNKYEKMSEDELIKTLSDMYEESSRAPKDTYITPMQDISNVLMLKFKYSESDIKKMLQPEKEDIRFDPHENAKDIEKDY